MKLFFFAFVSCILLKPSMSTLEYNGHFIEFEANLKDGTTTHGFVYKAHLYNNREDVVNKTISKVDYEVLLNNEFMDGLGDYTYFRNRIKYTYQNPYQEEKLTIYKGVDKTEINLNTIQSFTIIELIEQTYAIGISSTHTIEDLSWMQQKPVQFYSFGGNLCSHDIYIHKATQQTEKTILKLEQLDLKYRDHMQFLELEVKGTDGEDHYKATEILEKYEDAQDAKVSELLDGFTNEKVVIISMCTC